MIKYILLSLALIAILIGIIYEEKLIAFEDKVKDRLAWLVAQVIVKYRRIKRAKQAKAAQNRRAVTYQHR